ncbi:MAG: 16S rRNA (guanine(966)-N(2))-methyltransferase RsmD [Mycobacteriaceae bacterium]
MTRIIAGVAGGRRLRVPPSGTRPTSDRVREALFSAIEARIDLADIAVLDLYAGSGALGLEALSRGAAEVLLVESDARAVATIEKNIVELGLSGAVVRQSTVNAVLSTVHHRYDLVFIDPPYAVDSDEVSAVLLRLSDGWLNDGGLVAVERSSRSAITQWPHNWGEHRSKKYGETRIDLATVTV